MRVIDFEMIRETINEKINEGSAADTRDNDRGIKYGDYFGAALDPSDSSHIWVAGEYYVHRAILPSGQLP
jgi:hypothetical protein